MAGDTVRYSTAPMNGEEFAGQIYQRKAVSYSRLECHPLTIVILKQILEPIYEGSFLHESHGFRGMHTQQYDTFLRRSSHANG